MIAVRTATRTASGPLLPLSASGERVGVRRSRRRWSKLLPLTLTLSPRRSGERGPGL